MEESTATVPKDVPLQPPTLVSATQPYSGRPPPSPLSGGYLLIVISETLTDAHKAVILQKLAKGKLIVFHSILLNLLRRDATVTTLPRVWLLPYPSDRIILVHRCESRVPWNTHTSTVYLGHDPINLSSLDNLPWLLFLLFFPSFFSYLSLFNL